MNWISVKDRFPEPEDEVILFHPFKRVDGTEEFIIFVGYWDKLNAEWVCGWSGMLPHSEDTYVQSFIDENFRLKKREITHWSPLPQPPNK